MNPILIRREMPGDYREVENLTREAFWNVYRPGCDEHYIVHILRNHEDFIPELDLVMEKEGRIIGHILYMRAEICADGGRVVPVMSFGPISIAPDEQRKGYGKVLSMKAWRARRRWAQVRSALRETLPSMGIAALPSPGRGNPLLCGTRAGDRSLFLLRELKPGYLDGVTGVYRPSEGYLSMRARRGV